MSVKFANTVLKCLFIAALMLASPVLVALDQFTEPFEVIFVCENENGLSEEIYLSGTLRFKIQEIANDNHSTLVAHMFVHGEGEGLTTGSEYHFRGKVMELLQIGSSVVYINNDWMPLIGKGQAENYMYKYKVRWVMNANGEVVVDYFDANECIEVD